MSVPDDLAQALWSGPLPDPSAPASDLAATLPNVPYETVLEHLTRLHRHGLPIEPTLSAALRRYPWSIDLHALAVRAARGDDSIEALRLCVKKQKRRYGVLAWALWSAGRISEALDCFDTLSDDVESVEQDRLARAEICILAGLEPEKIPGAAGLRLSLLRDWRFDGGAALCKRIDLEAPGFPAAAPLWTWIIDALITERDFSRARAALRQATQRLGDNNQELAALRIRLALDCEDPETARKALAVQTKRHNPWQWTPRQHVQYLRCSLMINAAHPSMSDISHHADRARRLYPHNPQLRTLWRAVQERTADWNILSDALMSDNINPIESAMELARLGLHEAAWGLLQTQPKAPPDQRVEWRLKRAQILLRFGRPVEALGELGLTPEAWPQRADHVYWASEIHLSIGNADAALALLEPALQQGPTRMGLLLNAARACFLLGHDERAKAHLSRFDTLKTVQLGAPQPPDLRNHIIDDAMTAAEHGLSEIQSPALAARAFARSRPAFKVADPTPNIPPILAHYWEGPCSLPVERGARRWAELHPQMQQTVFDAPMARSWLSTHAVDLVSVFDAQTLPATRADLFRIALLAHQGGVFADLDEYPRAPITDWLTQARAVMVIEEGHGTIANNFLAAVPGLPLFTRLQARVAEQLRSTEAPYPWWHSGPAQVTLEARIALSDPDQAKGLRFLSQADYDQRVATNLPFPHKQTAAHWR